MLLLTELKLGRLVEGTTQEMRALVHQLTPGGLWRIEAVCSREAVEDCDLWPFIIRQVSQVARRGCCHTAA